MKLVDILINKVRSLGSSILVCKLGELHKNSPTVNFIFKCFKFEDSILRKSSRKTEKPSLFFPKFLNFTLTSTADATVRFTVSIGCNTSSAIYKQFKNFRKSLCYGSITLSQLLSKSDYITKKNISRPDPKSPKTLPSIYYVDVLEWSSFS